MAIVFHDTWDIEKGKKDAKRHQTKVDKAIRENIKNVIGEETIITRNESGKKTVRIPIPYFKDYFFKHTYSGQTGGAGQGDGEGGDVIGKRPKDGGQDESGAGSGHGESIIDAEVDLDYLLEVMFEDLGLPWLDEKKKNSTIVHKGWKFENISKKGAYSRIHLERTMMAAIENAMVFVSEIMNQTDCSKDEATKAFKQAKGDINEAIAIIREDRLDNDTDASIIINDESLRFKQIEEDTQICSNAVVIAMMDVSGSMTSDKKYLCRSLLFWLVNFLRKKYDHVDIRFIQHSDIAEEVDEQYFFQRSTSGGTLSHTAFDKAKEIIEHEYPKDEWNTYCVYCSDGDDFEPDHTVSSIEDVIKLGINMMSYIEVRYAEESTYYGESTLIPAIKNKWPFNNFNGDDTKFINETEHFIISVMKDKKDVWPTLKYMLGIKNGKDD